jgi:hypothetical protein
LAHLAELEVGFGDFSLCGVELVVRQGGHLLVRQVLTRALAMVDQKVGV